MYRNLLIEPSIKENLLIIKKAYDYGIDDIIPDWSLEEFSLDTLEKILNEWDDIIIDYRGEYIDENGEVDEELYVFTLSTPLIEDYYKLKQEIENNSSGLSDEILKDIEKIDCYLDSTLSSIGGGFYSYYIYYESETADSLPTELRVVHDYITDPVSLFDALVTYIVTLEDAIESLHLIEVQPYARTA